MRTAIDIALIAISLPAGLAAVYFTLMAAMTLRSARSVPTLRGGLDAPPPTTEPPTVCVIVPAHNEQDVIAGLVSSVLAQDHQPLHLVLALDRCADGTAEAARNAAGADQRLEIIEIDHCPEDWAGKVHAAWRGVQESNAARSADLLLFADADTAFDPACVRAAVNLLAARRLDMLSLLSTLGSRHWWELIAQPVAAYELLRHFPLHRVNSDVRDRTSFANGQFMLFTREAYNQIGGHESVRDELLEDLAFARKMKFAGLRNGLFLADGLLTCRMYASWPAFLRGWKRIFIESAGRRPSRLASWARRLFATEVALPALALIAALGGALGIARDHSLPASIALGAGAAGILAWLIAMLIIRRLQGAPLWTAPLAPAGAALTARLLSEAAADLERGRAVEWAGRAYARPTR